MRATVDTSHISGSHDSPTPLPRQSEPASSAANQNPDRVKSTDGWLPFSLCKIPKKVSEGFAFCQLKVNMAVDVVKNHPNRNTVAVFAVSAVILGIIGFLVMQGVIPPAWVGVLIVGGLLGGLGGLLILLLATIKSITKDLQNTPGALS